MIEQAIYFALGCCVTGLLALLFAPVFWQRALRLTRQRLQLQIPVSMQEIMADRDQLRAQFAVERLRLEQAVETAHGAKGHDMVELGRRTMEIAALSEEIETLKTTVGIQEKTLEEANRSTDERSTQIGSLNAMLQENATKLAEYRRRAETAETERSRLLSETDSQRTSIASLKTVGMGLEIRLADAERALVAERESVGGLRSRLETAMEHAARHESAGLLVSRELEDAKAQRRQAEDDLAAARTLMKSLRDEHERLLAHSAGAEADWRKSELALRSDLDDSRRRAGKALAEVDAGQTALEQARLKEEEMARKLAAFGEQEKAAILLRRELDETRTRLRQSDDELKAVQAAVQEARSRDAAELRGQKLEHEASTQSARRELEEAKARIAQLQSEVIAAQGHAERSRLGRTEIEQAHAALTAEHAALSADQAALVTSHAAALAKLNGELADMAARIEDGASRQAAAETAAEAARDAAAQTLATAKDREQASGSVRQQLDEAQTRARQLQNELGAALARLDEAARESQILRDRQGALQAGHVDEAQRLRREVEDAKAQIRKLDEKLNQANVLLGEARETVEQHRLGAMDQTRDEGGLAAALAEAQRLAAALAASDEQVRLARQALDEAGDREKAAAIQYSLQSDKDRRNERRLKEQLDALTAENAALQERMALPEPVDQIGVRLDGYPDGDEAGLRASIHSLGMAVARLTQTAEAGPAAKSAAPANSRRSAKDKASRPVGVA